MKPEDKAKELFDKYFLLHESAIDKNGVWIIAALNKGLAKKCALIAVDEILKNNIILFEDVLNDQYWQNIKQEIEKL